MLGINEGNEGNEVLTSSSPQNPITDSRLDNPLGECIKQAVKTNVERIFVAFCEI